VRVSVNTCRRCSRAPLRRAVSVLLPHGPSSPRHPFLRFMVGAYRHTSRQPEPAASFPSYSPCAGLLCALVFARRSCCTRWRRRGARRRPPTRQPDSSSRAVLVRHPHEQSFSRAVLMGGVAAGGHRAVWLRAGERRAAGG
jgi:hypothetical protein